ncbi:MAG: SsrA-binding protein SmpB [Patescibacteria group bacterium]|nr:SsrA-binding protein SmpB [Patescibacteria group bacterium]
MNLIEHKKARFNYDFLEHYEAGIELLGFEVKSVRKGNGKLEGSHVVVRDGEAFIVGMSIPPYQPLNTPQSYDPERTRKLLLTKKEIALLAGFEGQKGLTIVPIALYSKGRTIKLSVAIARGRKKHDKRRVIKERESRREIERTLKNK